VTHNALSRSMERIPMWLVQAVVGVLLSGLVAWTTWATATTTKNDARIAVVEDHQKGIDKNLDEIKDTQREMNHKLDKLIERRR